MLPNITVQSGSRVPPSRLQHPRRERASHRLFAVSASVKTCASKPAVSRGHSIDSGKAVIEPTSFTASVTATTGAHVLHVKCWGQQVNDQVLININVTANNSTATPWSVIAVRHLLDHSDSVDGHRHIRLDNLLHYRWFRPNDFFLSLFGPCVHCQVDGCPGMAGAELREQRAGSRQLCDFYCFKRTIVPSYARVEKQVQLLPNWRIKHDPATPGTSTGSMTLVSDPIDQRSDREVSYDIHQWGRRTLFRHLRERYGFKELCL